MAFLLEPDEKELKEGKKENTRAVRTTIRYRLVNQRRNNVKYKCKSRYTLFIFIVTRESSRRIRAGRLVYPSDVKGRMDDVRRDSGRKFGKIDKDNVKVINDA